MSTTTEAFVFLAKYIIAKHLQQEVDGDFSICVDEHRPCGLFITKDIKIYQWCVIKR